jgi:DNA-binding GntR family transcriptional regulator
MTPLSRETLQSQTYLKLRDALMRGRFIPGDVVSLRTVAVELGISPMPVRDAVRHLIAEKALEVRSNRTVAVPVLSQAKLAEVRELRILLEGLVAERATALLDNSAIVEMKGLNVDMEAALRRGDSKRYLLKNQAFHFRLYNGSSMQTTVDMIANLWLQIGPSFNFLFSEKQSEKNSPLGDDDLTHWHNLIIEGLEKRDAAAVRDAVEQDIGKGMTFLLEQSTAQ